MKPDPPHDNRPVRVLVALFQGGGNIALILPIAARLVARGHDVRVLAGPGVRAERLPVSARFQEQVAATGATLVRFQEPSRHPYDDAPARQGLVRGWTPRQLAAVANNVATWRWAPAWAANVAAELRRAPADVVAADFVLLGALVAAEAVRTPSAALVHGFYKHRPAPGLPPAYGSSPLPAHGPLGAVRDWLYAGAVHRLYRRDALPVLNQARAELGLAPFHAPFAQYDRAGRVLILTSAAFDFPARRLPPNVRYVGAPFDDISHAPWTSPWRTDDPRPLVIASLSTLPQGQGPVMQRLVSALAPLPVRALVTLGPALDPDQFDVPAHVHLERFVPHAAVLPQAAAMVSQAGLGTVMLALAHGVPLVCIPLIGDQPSNAARVVAHGAGVQAPSDASPEQIRQAIQRVLTEAHFREGARRLARVLAMEDGAEIAAQELAHLARP